MNFRYIWRYSDVKPINWARCSRNKCMRSDFDLCPLQHGSNPTEGRVAGVFSIIFHKYKCFAASRSKKWREDTKVRMNIIFLKKKVHKPDWQDYFLYVFRTINVEHNINWLPIRLSLVLLHTLVLWLQIPSQPHILQNSIFVFQTFIPSCFCEEGFLVRYVQYAYSMLDVGRTDTRIWSALTSGYKIFLQQVIQCFTYYAAFVCPMVHKITPHDSVLSQINPSHILRTHIF